MQANQIIDYLTLITVMFALIYGFAPAALYLSRYLDYNDFWVRYMYNGAIFDIERLALIAIAFFSLRAGWNAASGFEIAKQTLSFKQNAEADESFDHRRRTAKILIVGFALLFASIAAYYVYSQAYGGFIGLATVSNAIRGGWIKIDNSWSFLKRFGGLSVFASYLFFAIAYSKHSQATSRTTKTIGRIGFLISIAFSIYVLLTWQGRLTMAFYLLTLLLAHIALSNTHIKIYKLMAPLTIAGILLYFGDDILFSFRQTLGGSYSSVPGGDEGAQSVFDFFLGELSFPIVSVGTAIYAIGSGLTPLRYFVDIPLSILYLIPERWFPQTIDTVSIVNTNLVDASLTGTIPADMVSFGIYSLGALGPPITAFLLGMFAHLFQGFIASLEPPALRAILFYAFGIQIANTIPYGDPTNMLEGAFYLLLGSAITYIALRFRIGVSHDWKHNRKGKYLETARGIGGT